MEEAKETSAPGTMGTENPAVTVPTEAPIPDENGNGTDNGSGESQPEVPVADEKPEVEPKTEKAESTEPESKAGEETAAAVDEPTLVECDPIPTSAEPVVTEAEQQEDQGQDKQQQQQEEQHEKEQEPEKQQQPQEQQEQLQQEQEKQEQEQHQEVQNHPEPEPEAVPKDAAPAKDTTAHEKVSPESPEPVPVEITPLAVPESVPAVPELSTSVPEAVFDVTDAAPSVPEHAPAVPAVPEPSPAVPEPVQVAPVPSSAVPEPAQVAPEPSPAVPEPAQVAPVPSLAVPEPAQVAPEPSLAVPEPAQVAPEPSLAVPEPAQVAPEQSSAVPEPVSDVTDAAPSVPEHAPAVPAAPEPSSAVPEPAQVAPDPSSAVPEGKTEKPPGESKRRDSIEKMSNYLRQFRSSGGFRKFTASQFMKVWNHYDSDGNGYIADSELDGFLREFVISSVNEDQVRPEIISESAMALFKETFMDAFDENQDGMIDIAELAEILPTDENFLLLFHLKNPLESSVEFMRIWREYDKSCKGFIETQELKPFLKHILDNQKTSVSDEKLNEYTETILNLFDSNRDGKLQLCEMARLMPVKQNFLSKPILKGASCITRSDIDRLFRIYDQNRNGTIEDEELSGLLKDLMDLGKKDYTLEDIEHMKKVIMDHWDLDKDGTISKSELRMFLVQQCKLSAESQGLQYDDEGDDYDDDDY